MVGCHQDAFVLFLAHPTPSSSRPRFLTHMMPSPILVLTCGRSGCDCRSGGVDNRRPRGSFRGLGLGLGGVVAWPFRQLGWRLTAGVIHDRVRSRNGGDQSKNDLAASVWCGLMSELEAPFLYRKSHPFDLERQWRSETRIYSSAAR
jgi:hypothetical protein